MTPHPNEESAPDACEHGWHKRYVRPCPECAPPPALPSAAVEQVARALCKDRKGYECFHTAERPCLCGYRYSNLRKAGVVLAAQSSQVADLTRQRDQLFKAHSVEMVRADRAEERAATAERERDEAQHHAQQWRNVGREGAARYWSDRCHDAEARAARLEAALNRIERMEMPPSGWSAFIGNMKEVARAALAVSGTAPAEDAPP